MFQGTTENASAVIGHPGSLRAVANWHADKAIIAYRADDLDAFARHIAICDQCRREAWIIEHAAGA